MKEFDVVDSQSEQVSACHIVQESLRELLKVLSDVPDTVFTELPQNYDQASPIGAHVRHILDHVEAYVVGVPISHIKYHVRVRATADEKQRTAAIGRVEDLCVQLLSLNAYSGVQNVCVSDILLTGSSPYTFMSTVDREGAFVLSHTIHHFATISSMLHAFGEEVPRSFGYAPSTITAEVVKS